MKDVSQKGVLRCLRSNASHIGGLQGVKTRYRPYVCPIRAILEQIPEGSRLFDVGCGSGALLCLGVELLHLSKACGYDVSESAVEASGTFKGIEVRLLSKQGPMPSFQGYDVVTLVDVLHHIPPGKQRGFLTEIVHNMDVGSTLLISDIDASRKVGAFLNQLHDLLLAGQWVHPWCPGDVLAVLGEIGCEECHCSLHWSLWYPHFIVKVRKCSHVL
ncbi:MAG: hypothetical protein BMS9Abin18_0627 [Zetaproteobacteria bacterium]|nr:MAG: hypothetical protein BMS9Abin18_0627 [Zetaproteobacteria bacterium]